ncbi:CGNR zinc finger domain-containing protein [Nonomuraea roseoviolacea]|uniref:RNA-binding Zn ribbon-like protein n=1 Tax=Nonomuraea roseoviolacea subsp. carminata TaxID=160689 RepID=A0ABT1JUZ5_9ACTN|nr:CGNR zinc finger domain-containing protein [Nonomuraea roseoviolacea]MCP2345570.1 putative RNA-binding Zn ribbon-like protein [Nonomuraea roseoviolacea subsp. carminata]
MRVFAETGLVALDLANTWDAYLDEPERLPDAAALRRFCAELSVTPDDDGGAEDGGGAGDDGGAGPEQVADRGDAADRGEVADLVEVRAVRDRLRAVLSGADPTDRSHALARWTAELPLRPAVEEADGVPRLRLAAVPGASLAGRLAVRAVQELLDLAAEGDWERVRMCAAAPCRDAFVDRSRPGRRQFCSTRCANRAHAAASRARHRS